MSFLPIVSVIVPAYNAHATLGACLTSLQLLTYPRERFEVIVVDNASTDETRALAESFAVRVVSEAKRGPAAARNRGIAATQSDVIAFTDADCIVEPNWLTELVQPLQDERVGIVGGTIQAMPPCNAIERYGEHIHNHRQAIELFQPGYAITMNWASPRALLNELGGFDESLRRGEDTDLAWRILQHNRRMVYQASAVIRHGNENTLRGLFREGVQHGYYSVPVNRKHAKFLQPYGHRRVNRASYARLVTSLREYMRTRSSAAQCEFTFNSGKKIGQLLASARYLYVDL